MSRAKVMADVLARLEAERYAPLPPQRLVRDRNVLPPVTPEQAAENQRILMEALSDDPTVVAWRERQAWGNA